MLAFSSSEIKRLFDKNELVIIKDLFDKETIESLNCIPTSKIFNFEKLDIQASIIQDYTSLWKAKVIHKMHAPWMCDLFGSRELYVAGAAVLDFQCSFEDFTSSKECKTEYMLNEIFPIQHIKGVIAIPLIEEGEHTKWLGNKLLGCGDFIIGSSNTIINFKDICRLDKFPKKIIFIGIGFWDSTYAKNTKSLIDCYDYKKFKNCKDISQGDKLKDFSLIKIESKII